MFSKLKYLVYGIVGIAVVYVVLTDTDDAGVTRTDLDQVLNVAVGSLDSMEGKENITKENAMDTFASSYAQELNASQPAIHAGAIGVATNTDGSFDGFADDNNNAVKDSGEKELFNLEVDSENNRLIASDETYTRDHGFSGTGLIAGMLIGSMLSRQRAAGKNPASRKATSKSAYKSARSRAGSGSHSRGK